MKPSRTSLRDFDSLGSPNSESTVYFKTAIRATGAGDRTRPSLERGEGGAYGIQKETTVSVRTEPNPRRRDGDDVM